MFIPRILSYIYGVCFFLQLQLFIIDIALRLRDIIRYTLLYGPLQF